MGRTLLGGWIAGLCAIAMTAVSAHAAAPSLPERPNIVLIVFEDMSPRIGAFGDPLAKTPVLDALARESIRYPNTFTTAGVCAPSRSALITGVHQQTMGTHQMRTKGVSGLGGGGPVEYEAVPPAQIKAFPELLRAAGYYTTNNWKTDYQFGDPFTVWDDNRLEAHWRNRPQGAPFFAMINLYSTHESFLWPYDRDAMNPIEAAVHKRNAETFDGKKEAVTDPTDVEVPPYLPDTAVVRADIARQYDNIHFTEREVRRVLDELEEDGVLDQTIVIVTTDHGDGLPRMKRSVYDSGLKVPLMHRFPDGTGAGDMRAELVSFVDLAPTLLHFAGVEIPDYMQGRPLFGSQAGTPRDYIFATHDRVDALPDRIKAARDLRFKYIRNYQPELAYFRHVAFRDSLPTMQEIWAAADTGALTETQRFYLTAPKPAHELYDTQNDPHEVVNLAGDPGYADHLTRLQGAMDDWIARVGDLSALQEIEMIERMWPGLEQPVTAAPQGEVGPGGEPVLRLASATEGASIGYRIADRDAETDWRLYTGPVAVPDGVRIEAKAIRYGYAESAVTQIAVP